METDTYHYKIFSFHFLVILFIFLNQFSFAQSTQYIDHISKADSIYSKLQLANTQREKLELLSELVWEIHYSDSAQPYYLQAIELSKTLNDPNLAAQNLNRLGVYYRNNNLQEEALLLYEEALQISRKANNNTQIGHSLNSIGQIYFYRGLFEEALEYYLEAADFFLAENDEEGLAYNYTGLSLVLGELGRYFESIETINKAIAIRENLGNERQLTVSRFNRANLLMDMGDYSSAEKDMLNLYEYGLQYDLVRAINALEKLVELKIKQGDTDMAFEYANKAIDLHQQRPNSESMVAILQQMNQLSFQIGNQEQANYYNELLQAEKNILNAEKTKNHLSSITIKKQKDEIEALSRENELIEKNRRFRLYLALALLVIIAGLVFILFNYYKFLLREKAKNKELNQQKEKIENQAKELDELNRVKDKIFSIISHDLRGPLHSLLGMVQLFNEESLSKEDFKEYLPKVAQSLGENEQLLENLLIWSRNQMKGIKVSKKLISVSKLVDKNIQILSKTNYFKNQEIQNLIPLEIKLITDPDMLEIVLRNLLTNALKFTHAGSEIIFSATEKSDSYVFSIRDNGIGIHEEVLEKLFRNTFFSSPGTKKEKGTGIGLLLSRELIQLNKGDIWVKSQPGEGAEFFFSLPKN
ncbi:Membrane associated signal transduction histidine kinase [Indibacter alkaliphilus LW1]|uniref:histidine kinase n=1 Tax=Indibacter alkaliphilus (strain CCUG 57479 / KCTC 22604 / LW1) TaxID=1189612 RepID=S2E8L1_INDAL|nr:ATP-binding protein [Indibacter alkaliphilus]EOZ98623.1 Membrane associated signal transduction histidine kinase [Indibacter alkaliphilus LW1]